MEYVMNGVMRLIVAHTCDCPYCKQTTESESFNVVSMIVSADSIEEAIEITAMVLHDQNFTDLRNDLLAWDSQGIRIDQVSEELKMRRIGAPELPLFQ